VPPLRRSTTVSSLEGDDVKVRFLAFTLECEGKVSLLQLVNYMKAQTPVKVAHYDRIVRVTEKGGYYVGLVLTVKDQRRFCELAKDDLVVEVRELEEGKAVVDFNFFVVNAATNRGLYQYYHHSLGLKKFGEMLNAHMKQLVHRKVDAEIAALEAKEGPITEKRKKATRSALQTKVSMTQLVRPEDLDDLVQEMARVKRLRFDLANVVLEGSTFAPIRNHVKTARTELVFERDSPEKVKSAVRGLLDVVSGAKGKVVGEDDDGQEHIYSLLENYDVFGELEFDAAAKTMNLKLDDFAGSAMISQLLSAMKKHRDHFEE
jgi:hypothetical protein